MFEYKRENRLFFVRCYWCDEHFTIKDQRSMHLLAEHPRFLDEWSELNKGTWLPWRMEIPEKPDDLDSEGDSR